MSVQTPALGVSTNWSSVQVLFLLDGGYYASAGPCSVGCPGSQHEMSSAYTYFVENAASFAQGIVSAHPGLNISFAAAATIGTPGSNTTSDGDGLLVGAAAPYFLSPTAFGQAVNASSAAVPYGGNLTEGDTDLSDNPLQSDVIAAAFGSLTGAVVPWDPMAHHVLVWLGVSAPLDPSYPERFCLPEFTGSNSCALGPSCEPAHQFNPNDSMPSCERWVNSTSSPSNNSSIADVALSSTPCLGAAGGYCTIDAIILNATPTDPYSSDWSTGNATVHSEIRRDAASIVQAGCDIATVTGGTWQGPWGTQCLPLGTQGTLNFTGTTNLSTPGISSALSAIGLGNTSFLSNRPLAFGTANPMFQVVLAPNVTLASDPGFSVSCRLSSGQNASCPTTPDVRSAGTSAVLDWNWSGIPSANRMTWGESWVASFNVLVNALPSSNLPLIDCATPICHASGSPLSSGGQTSDVRFRLQYFGPYVDLGFSPLAVRVLNLYPPGGTLTQTPSSGVAPLAVSYSFGLGGGIPPYRFSWLFGDGTSGLTTSPTTTHSFSSPGNFSTILLFEDAQGRDFAATTVEHVFAPLLVHASVLPTTGGSLSVDVEASIQGGAAPYDVSWNSSGRSFQEDLTTPGLSHAEFSYDHPGNYSVELRVHDASGQVGTAALTVEVARAPSVPLSVSVLLLGFERSSSTACGPYDGTARLLGTASGGVAPYNFSWSFGDGWQGGGVAPNHTYLSPGRYEVRLLVVDSDGITTSGGINLTIPPSPSTCPTVLGSSGTGPTLVLGLVSALAVGVAAIGRLVLRARSGSRPAARRDPP